jgi:hypothetical protein
LLLHKNKQGTLTQAEAAELDAMEQRDDLITSIKIEARRALAARGRA